MFCSVKFLTFWIMTEADSSYLSRSHSLSLSSSSRHAGNSMTADPILLQVMFSAADTTTDSSSTCLPSRKIHVECGMEKTASPIAWYSSNSWHGAISSVQSALYELTQKVRPPANPWQSAGSKQRAAIRGNIKGQGSIETVMTAGRVWRLELNCRTKKPVYVLWHACRPDTEMVRHEFMCTYIHTYILLIHTSETLII